MIKAIIFDMDGVLIDAKDWHYEALNLALGLFGFVISRYDHLVTYDGLPTSKKLEMLSLEGGLPIELHSFINEMKQQYTMKLVHDRCKPRFVHEYALSSLVAKGYKLAVASNSVPTTIEVMMEKAQLDRYLNFMISASDVEKPKPHPEIYLTAIAKLGLKAEECLVVEDNDNGIAAARASGAHVLVVKTVDDVNLENILNEVHCINQGDKC